MQQNRQRSSHCNHGSLLRIFSTALCDRFAMSSEIAVRRERAQNVLSCTDEQASAQLIAGFGDPQLRPRQATLIESRDEPVLRTDITTPREAMGIFD